jgi:GTP pyrophosphokinase
MPLSERFDQALAFAAELHRNQSRKGTKIPYVAHLLAVTALVLEHGGDEDEAVAALLHDAIEDQGRGGATRQEIRRRFGDRVVEIVAGCTDTDKDPKPPWRERKEKYLAHLRSASPSVRLVTAGDKLHNARSLLEDYRELGESVWNRFNGGKEGTLWYLRSVVGELNADGTTPLVRELERVVAELERLTVSTVASRNG